MFDPLSNIKKTELICLDANAVQDLIDGIVAKIKEMNLLERDLWIKKEETMRILRISSEETLNKFCKEGTIERSKTTDKHFLYNRDSILAFIQKHIEK